MAFSFTPDQAQFRDIVARFCRDKSPPDRVRELMSTPQGYDSAQWRQISQELGLTGIHLPEAHGGAGFGPVELGIVMEEFGRALVCAPYFSTAVLAATALSRFGSETQIDALLPGMLDGTVVATLATTEQDGHFIPDRETTTATQDGSQFRLSGHKRFVTDGATAGLILISAHTSSGRRLFAVEQGAAGLIAQPVASMDPTRKLAELTLNDTPAQRIGADVDVDLTGVWDLALIALANEMIGGAHALLDAAVEYTKLRVQFGRTIGSFQAIKHRLADLLLDVELARSAAYQAAQVAADGDGNVTEMASLAKAQASDAYLQAAIQCIQLHGGVGFTWENDTHLWFKRAKSSEVFLGTPQQHRERMLVAMGV